MYNNDERSVEVSHEEDGGAGDENQNRDFTNANLLDKKKLEVLKSYVDWDVESDRYIIFDQFFRLIGDWKGPLSDLRNIFEAEEIEHLLLDSIYRWGTGQGENQAAQFIWFLVQTGYKNEPQVDKDDKLMLHRRTALHLAEYNEHNPIALELFNIYNRFDANYIDDETGLTHFHVACMWGCKDVVEKFLELGQDPNILVTVTGSSPLHLSLMSDHVDPEIVEILLRHAANPNVANKKKLTAVHFVSMGSDDYAHLVRMFIELTDEKYLRVQINPAGWGGLTPLHYAVSHGRKNLTESLLKYGANPNLPDEGGSTALHKICLENHDVELAKILFEHCQVEYKPVEVDAQDYDGCTPMHHAVYRGNQLLVEFLLMNGADPNKAQIRGFTPLHVICDKASDDSTFLVTFFKICKDTRQNVQIEARDKKGQTPLQLAVGNILPNLVDVLLDHGADLSSFVFPTAEQFNEINDYCKYIWDIKLELASGLLLVVERLEKRGYELEQSDALTIMAIFTEYEAVESSDVEESWYDDEKFEIEAKKIMVNPSLSLYDLTRLRPEQAAKILSFADYLELGCSRTLKKLPQEFRINCVEHLCEKLARRFFQRWAQYPFWEQILHRRLPILCCDMIIDELTNKDLFNICSAAAK